MIGHAQLLVNIIMSRKITTPVVLLLLLVCRFSSAQDGGCSPDPPGSLIGGPNKLSSNVPTVNAAGNSEHCLLRDACPYKQDI